ncbi:hypothetical protein SSX86_031215 [Deinandra increscens subsp. villosa]|uniref:non-specific serine/threonine protein kinase n=1 Tax=Deinandra increscens subsp. villosa TaxID=3103831 RepID=A0AAP0C9D0_9ASTR
MSHAVTQKNSNIALRIDLNPGDTTGNVLYYMHLNEIEILKGNQKREFNIYLNGLLVAGPYSPIYHTTLTVYSLKPQPSAPMYTFTINKTPDSTLLPIISAAEFYSVKDLPQRHTYDKDGKYIVFIKLYHKVGLDITNLFCLILAAAMWSIKSTYRLTKNWQGDPCAPQEFVWDGVICNYDDPESPRIVMLNLSTDGLIGEIDSGLANLTMMQTLDLSNNNLTGTVPDFLSGLKFLTEINLKGNNFTGPIPSVLLEKASKGSLLLSFDGESTGASTSSCDRNTCKNKKDNKFIIPLIVAVSVVAILIALAFIFMWKIIKKKERGTRLETRKKQYTYSDIHNITNNFNVVLGKGGFGTVYRGIINDKQVAVKMLSGSSTQGDKEFQAEVNLLLSVHHKSLTSLVGYCDDESHKGIIYEYMANGNLESRLLDRTSGVLNWEERLQIGGDVAQGLEYMHHGCKPPIVHRDVKCTNILLNEAFQAKLGDFGLSRAFPKDASYISTNVAGTPGYLDPECMITHKLTEKSDVYSFGVVLLVLITGQPTVITTEDNEKLHISRMVGLRLESGDMSNIVDPSLRGDFDVNSAWKAVELAMACVVGTPNKRPTMKDVVIELNDCLVSERARKEAIPNPNIIGSMSLNLEIAHDPTAV